MEDKKNEEAMDSSSSSPNDNNDESNGGVAHYDISYSSERNQRRLSTRVFSLFLSRVVVGLELGDIVILR